MELIAVLLSGLIALTSPINLGGEALLAKQIKKQFVAVEQLAVRIDNAPNYQILQGKLDHVRIAAQGVYPLKDLRIDRLEIETDPIALQGLKAKLAQPLQAGVKVVITEADLNHALQSPALIQRLKQFLNKALGSQAAGIVDRYQLQSLRCQFLSDRRVQFDIDLTETGYAEILTFKIVTDVHVEDGQAIQLSNTEITANGQPLFAPLTSRLVAGLNQSLTVDRLEKSGITARILQLDFSQKQATIAAFAQVRPEALNRRSK
ncbi:MAG: hypothetical protein RLZZ511_3188 [Cyanobacteriota bacterium]|jgi:hypothetical protein